MNIASLLISFGVFLVIGLSIWLGSLITIILAVWTSIILILYFVAPSFIDQNDTDAMETMFFLRKIFCIAFVIRISTSFFIYFAGVVEPWFFAPDTYYYSAKGWHIAQYWLGQIDEFTYKTTISEWGTNIYFKIHALCFYILGEKVPFFPATLNCFIGSFLPLVSFLIAREFGVNKKCARWVSYLICFWPSIILWSSIGIRDIWSILAFNILLYSILKFTKKKSMSSGVSIALCLIVLFYIRAYLLPLILIALYSSYYISKSKNIVFMLFFSILTIIFVNQLDAIFHITDYLQPSKINASRMAFSSHAAGFTVDADLSSPVGYIKLIGTSLVYFLFAPFPWDLSSPLKRFTFPETIIFYSMVYYIIYGLRLQMKLNLSKIIPLLLLFFVISCSYSLLEPNVGTLYRHKAQVVSFILIFAPIGFYYRKIPIKDIPKMIKQGA